METVTISMTAEEARVYLRGEQSPVTRRIEIALGHYDERQHQERIARYRQRADAEVRQ